MGRPPGTRIETLSLTTSVAIGVGLLLLTFAVFFCYTHGYWYDGMKPDEKVKFWTDFGVSAGTIALALVTWASVFETQRILLGEDRRFQQSRVPAVVVSNQNSRYVRTTEHGELTLMLENVGDGAARSVAITVHAILRFHKFMPDPLEPTIQRLTEVERFHLIRDDLTIFSYLPTSTPRAWNVAVSPPPVDVVEISYEFSCLEIGFADAFGTEYLVKYHDFPAQPQTFVFVKR